ncbi:ABC transporter transmembrane domain-containing protein [Umboniibacter marinipuniceus]|uniref:ABC-type bacteriocin/lantibiotic exporter with double-glycine peptidase domain n=1 Tax=Umboniibacter marinipuniceus TaxID=569599 RepID=A0A3M0A7N1_9GAMM|nr:ABC transporter transmembrane domain-containing protein [Umboniibacter marinipuniceus]RMA78475.1 ABC-type bacteriocin/lantibiotic exporter with double-glycine peptidase domain [Umboniibacter marinipuniceus]
MSNSLGLGNIGSKKAVVKQVLAPSLLINILSLALPLTILQIYDRILPNQSYGTAALLLGGAFIALTTEAFLRYVRTWLLAASASNTERRTYESVIQSLNKANGKDLGQLGAGGVHEGLKSVSVIKDYYSGGLVSGLIDLPFVVIFLALVWYVGGSLVLIPVIVWFIAGSFVWFASVRAKSYSLEAAENERGRASFLIRIFNLLEGMKKQAAESEVFASFRRINQSKWIAMSKAEQNSAMAQESIQVASMATSVAIVLFGALVVLDGEMTTGGLAACSILSGRAVQPLSALIGLRMRFDSFEVADKTVNELTELSAHNYFAGTKRIESPLQAMRIRDVEFSRHSRSYILDAAFKPGDIVRINHSSSFVRSHALGIISGINYFQKGDLIWNDDVLRNYDYQSFREKCSYVAQRPQLYTGSLLDNLCGFNSDMTEQALAFARALRLDPIISELPEGVETKVGTTLGSPLSLGAIRLVNITAQLSAANRVVVIDSPEKYLDKPSIDAFVKVLQYLASQGAVIIMATDHPEFEAIQTNTVDVVEALEVSV